MFPAAINPILQCEDTDIAKQNETQIEIRKNPSSSNNSQSKEDSILNLSPNGVTLLNSSFVNSSQGNISSKPRYLMPKLRDAFR